MSQALPLSTADFWVRQVNLDLLSPVGREAMDGAFGGFIGEGLKKEVVSLRRGAVRRFLGLDEEAFPDSRFRVDHSSPRRFAGDRTLSRGRYHSLARDEEGHDGGTLLHELLAYYKPREPGWVSTFDLTIPEHRDAVMSKAASLPKAVVEELDLVPSSLVVAYHPVLGRPHPFAARHSDRVAPFLVSIPTIVKRLRLDGVVDLRCPETASWFTREMTRWRVDMDGEPVDLIPAKPPLRNFRDLIPTLLEQSCGGGQRALMSSAGLRLRQGGAQGMVYPSARVDSEVQVHRGAVVESVGWNFVDYRDGGPPEMTHIIDMDSAWPTKVGFWFANEPEGPYQLAYEDVQIEYATRGANKGSWSVSGLATWQEAWFRASSALSVLEAKDPELFDEIGPILNATWLQFASGKELLEVSDLVFGVLLEDAQDLNTASAWAEALATDGHQEISEAVQKLVDRAS